LVVTSRTKSGTNRLFEVHGARNVADRSAAPIKQTIVAKQQRETTTNAINADISRRVSLTGNMTQVTGALTSSLENFRMP
jgi:hypothetical protein